MTFSFTGDAYLSSHGLTRVVSDLTGSLGVAVLTILMLVFCLVSQLALRPAADPPQRDPNGAGDGVDGVARHSAQCRHGDHLLGQHRHHGGRRHPPSLAAARGAGRARAVDHRHHAQRARHRQCHRARVRHAGARLRGALAESLRASAALCRADRGQHRELSRGHAGHSAGPARRGGTQVRRARAKAPRRVMSAARAWSLLSMACVALAGFFAFRDLHITGDIEAFVPHAQDAASTRAAQSLASSDLMRTVIVTLTDTSDERALTGARTFSQALQRDRKLFTRIETGPRPETEKRLYELYFPRRYAFVASDAKAVQALDASWVDQRIQGLRAQLMGPLSTMLAPIAADDPWLLFPALLSDLRSHGGSALEVRDGQFLVSGKPTSVVFLTGKASPFDSEAAIDVSDAIERARRAVLSTGASAHLDIASVYAFSRAARAEITRDIGRISTVSTLAIVLLFWSLFRSLRSLALGALTLGTGVIAGACVCRLVFGSVHGITLAFGSSLLGVGIDFVAHYVNHCALERERSPSEIMRELWPGLLLGGATTALGFLAFAFSSFAGMQELALFSFASVAASLLATRYWGPLWVGVARAPTSLHLRLVSALAAWVRVSSRRSTRFALLAVTLTLCALGLPRLKIIDDVRVFNHADPAMVRETDRARAAVGFGDAGRFVLVTAKTDEQALARNDQVFAALERAKADGEIGAFRTAFYLLRSAATQRAVLSAFDARVDLRESTKQALARHGFVVDRFRGADLRSDQPLEPVTYALLEQNELGPLVAPFRTLLKSEEGACRDGCVGYLSYVQGVRDAERMQSLVGHIEGACTSISLAISSGPTACCDAARFSK